MGSKMKPGQFDCYNNAEPDEPMFVLLGRDQDAPQLVESWAVQRYLAGEAPAKVAEALQCARSMRKYRHVSRGAPSCQYGENCSKPATKIVTENNFTHFYWCGDVDNCHLHGEVAVSTFEDHFSEEIAPDLIELGT